ncbi:MAG: hypothetical protein HKN40_13140, partial [Winogradskyella sp.]|nr:hypothetical protein [Winogradskyella sp.]
PTALIDATADKFIMIPKTSTSTNTDVIEDTDLILEFSSASTVGDGVVDIFIEYEKLTV